MCSNPPKIATGLPFGQTPADAFIRHVTKTVPARWCPFSMFLGHSH